MPVTVDDATVGALGVTLPYHKDERFEREVKFFGIAASMIGHAIRVQRLMEAERKGLVQENRQLRQELKERYDFRNIVGNSRPMQAVYEQVAQVAHTQHDRAHPRRVGHGQGDDRARRALRIAARVQGRS